MIEKTRNTRKAKEYSNKTIDSQGKPKKHMRQKQGKEWKTLTTHRNTLRKAEGNPGKTKDELRKNLKTLTTKKGNQGAPTKTNGKNRKSKEHFRKPGKREKHNEHLGTPQNN